MQSVICLNHFIMYVILPICVASIVECFQKYL